MLFWFISFRFISTSCLAAYLKSFINTNAYCTYILTQLQAQLVSLSSLSPFSFFIKNLFALFTFRKSVWVVYLIYLLKLLIDYENYRCQPKNVNETKPKKMFFRFFVRGKWQINIFILALHLLVMNVNRNHRNKINFTNDFNDTSQGKLSLVLFLCSCVRVCVYVECHYLTPHFTLVRNSKTFNVSMAVQFLPIIHSTI